MAIAVWNLGLETGIPEIDQQHRALFDAINALAEAFQAGQAPSRVGESLAFLNRYTREHFDTEEAFMVGSGYPQLAAHQAEHAQLMARLGELEARHGRGFLVTADVALFLAEWLTHHINEVDMGYVTFRRGAPDPRG